MISRSDSKGVWNIIPYVISYKIGGWIRLIEMLKNLIVGLVIFIALIGVIALLNNYNILLYIAGTVIVLGLMCALGFVVRTEIDIRKDKKA